MGEKVGGTIKKLCGMDKTGKTWGERGGTVNTKQGKVVTKMGKQTKHRAPSHRTRGFGSEMGERSLKK